MRSEPPQGPAFSGIGPPGSVPAYPREHGADIPRPQLRHHGSLSRETPESSRRDLRQAAWPARHARRTGHHHRPQHGRSKRGDAINFPIGAIHEFRLSLNDVATVRSRDESRTADSCRELTTTRGTQRAPSSSTRMRATAANDPRAHRPFQIGFRSPHRRPVASGRGVGPAGCSTRKASQPRLVHLDLEALLPNVEPHAGVHVQVQVRDEDQREERDDVALPVVVHQLVAGDEQDEGVPSG